MSDNTIPNAGDLLAGGDLPDVHLTENELQVWLYRTQEEIGKLLRLTAEKLRAGETVTYEPGNTEDQRYFARYSGAVIEELERKGYVVEKHHTPATDGDRWHYHYYIDIRVKVQREGGDGRGVFTG